MKINLINFLRLSFFCIIVRPVLMICLGLQVWNRERLKVDKPRLVAANHNSHLDALVLLSLFKLSDLSKVKVVAAKDYFCCNPFMTWFSLNIIGIIPIDRQSKDKNATEPVMMALKDGYTVIIFPEGSRGNPEERQPFKYGIAKILEQMPEVQILPVYMHGLGKTLPRGDFLPVPFICKINIGENIVWQGDKKKMMDILTACFDEMEMTMKNSMHIRDWH